MIIEGRVFRFWIDRSTQPHWVSSDTELKFCLDHPAGAHPWNSWGWNHHSVSWEEWRLKSLVKVSLPIALWRNDIACVTYRFCEFSCSISCACNSSSPKCFCSSTFLNIFSKVAGRFNLHSLTVSFSRSLFVFNPRNFNKHLFRKENSGDGLLYCRLTSAEAAQELIAKKVDQWVSMEKELSSIISPLKKVDEAECW